MSDGCKDCRDHSGVITDLNNVNETQRELKNVIDKIHIRTTGILITLTISCILMLANFILKHYSAASAVAQEIITK